MSAIRRPGSRRAPKGPVANARLEQPVDPPLLDRLPRQAAQQATGAPTTGDTVTITDTAARLSRLESTLAQVPVVDTQRVESIQRALANGTYEINPERIADKLLAMESYNFV